MSNTLRPAKRALFALVALCFCVFETFAQTLHVGVIERPPYVYANADGTVKGQIVRQLSEVFKLAGVDARFQTHPLDQVTTYFYRSEFDVLIATRTIVNEPEDYLISESPVLELQYYAYHLPEKPKASALEDLFGHGVIWPIKLDEYRGELERWLNEHRDKMRNVAILNDLEEALPLLESGEADYAVNYIAPNTLSMMFSRRIRPGQLVASELFSLPIYVILRKSTPNAEAVMARVNGALAAL